MLSTLQYHRPASLEEACSLLQQLAGEAVPLAGGTDLIPDLERGLKTTGHVVSLRDLDELRGIRIEDDLLRLGALVTPTEISRSEVIRGRSRSRRAVARSLRIRRPPGRTGSCMLSGSWIDSLDRSERGASRCVPQGQGRGKLRPRVCFCRTAGRTRIGSEDFER